MHITTLRAVLKSKATISRIRKAIYNTSKLKYSCDHVKNSKGNIFLAVRVRDNKLKITDNKGVDITQTLVKICQGRI